MKRVFKKKEGSVKIKTDAPEIIRRSRLAGAYEDLNDAGLKNEIASRLKTLLSENDLSNKMLAGHLKRSILPAIAFHGALIEHGREKKDSAERIRSSVIDDAKSSASFFQVLGKIPFFFSLMRVMVKKGIQLNYGKSGWDFVWKRDDHEAIVWDCRRCFYADVFRKYGMPELTEIFCESDDVVYGNIPGVRWGRTKTIGKGDPVCDFSLFKEK